MMAKPDDDPFELPPYRALERILQDLTKWQVSNERHDHEGLAQRANDSLQDLLNQMKWPPLPDEDPAAGDMTPEESDRAYDESEPIPLTMAEAEAALAACKPKQADPAEVERIVALATSLKPCPKCGFWPYECLCFQREETQ